jgi:hypothetical protein
VVVPVVGEALHVATECGDLLALTTYVPRGRAGMIPGGLS